MSDLDPEMEAFLKKSGMHRPTWRGLVTVLNVVGKGLLDRTKAQSDRIAALEAEVEQLKARPLQKWAGVHIPGAQYAEASLVTKGGSLWAAMTTTTTTPGEPDSDWRLIVKGR